MTIGAPGTESFRRVIVKTRNMHFVPFLMQLKVLRQEVISNDDLKNRGGIDTTTKNHFLSHLAAVDKIRRRVTYNLEGKNLGDIYFDAIDVKKNITDSGKPGDRAVEGVTAVGDVIQGQSGAEFDLPFHFDGTDIDFPAQSAVTLESPLGVGIVGVIDQIFVTCSRLESRHRTKFIYYGDSMRLYQMLEMLYEELEYLGGDEHRVDVANPLASDEPAGQSSANREDSK